MNRLVQYLWRNICCANYIKIWDALESLDYFIRWRLEICRIHQPMLQECVSLRSVLRSKAKFQQTYVRKTNTGDTTFWTIINGFQRTNSFFCHKRTAIISNPTNKINNLKGLCIYICYRRNSVGGGSVRAGFNCTCKRFLSNVQKQLNNKKP